MIRIIEIEKRKHLLDKISAASNIYCIALSDFVEIMLSILILRPSLTARVLVFRFFRFSQNLNF